MDEEQVSELYNFLVDLEKEKLSEKNSKKRLVLLEKLGWKNKSECWENDTTATYEEINVNVLRKSFIKKTDRRSNTIQEKNSGINEVENHEEGDEDEDSDEEVPCEEIAAVNTQLTSINRKSGRISTLSNVDQTDITSKSYEGVLYKKNKLQHKKYIGVLIRHKLLLSHKNDGPSKDLTRIKVIKSIDLWDYEVSIAPSNGPKYELKLVCPGKKTHIYYCKNKADAETWEKEIKKTLIMNFAKEDQIETDTVNEDCPIYIKGDTYQVVQDKKSTMNTNLNHMKSNSDKSLDNYACLMFQSDTITTCKNDSPQTHAKAKKSKIHSLFNKVLHMRNKVLTEGKILLSGMLLVAIDVMEQWKNYYCIVKSQEFQIFKYLEEQLEPTMLNLRECHLQQTCDQNVLLLKSPQIEVQLKFKDHTELVKWQKVLIEQIEKKLFSANELEAPVEGLYDEIRETYSLDHEKMNKRPALPDCPMPITPDVTQVLLNINECSYMDAIECRGITKTKGKAITTTNELFNPYSNADEPTHLDDQKANNNRTGSLYNNININSVLPASIIDNNSIAKDKSKSMTGTIKHTSNNKTEAHKITTFDNQMPNVNMKNDGKNLISMEKKLEKTQKSHKNDNYNPNENKKTNVNKTIQAKPLGNKTHNEATESNKGNTNNIKKPGSFDQCKIKGIDTAALISKFSKSNSSINNEEPVFRLKSLPITPNQKLSNSHKALLRPPFGYNNSCNTNDTRQNKTNIKRYSDTSAMKSNLILEKIKMFENKGN